MVRIGKLHTYSGYGIQTPFLLVWGNSNPPKSSKCLSKLGSLLAWNKGIYYNMDGRVIFLPIL